MEARYIGDPQNDFDGPRTMKAFGLAFPKGKWVGLPEDFAFTAKLEGNRHFQTRADGSVVVEDPPQIEEAVETATAEDDLRRELTPAQEAALDRDGDGSAGGSLGKEELIDRLKALGEDFDARWGVPRLEKALKAAEERRAFIAGDDD